MMRNHIAQQPNKNHPKINNIKQYFSICGILLHTQIDNSDQIKKQLQTENGVEIHAATDDGRIVITVESDSQRQTGEIITAIQRWDGILSAALVYQYSGDTELFMSEDCL